MSSTAPHTVPHRKASTSESLGAKSSQSIAPALVPWDHGRSPDDHHALLVLLLLRPLSQDLLQNLLIGYLTSPLPIQSSADCQPSLDMDVGGIEESKLERAYI